jgi:antitoxin Phd
MIATWQLSEAKNKFSELIDRAVSNGPQIVTRRGKEVVVVLSREDYDRLTRDHSGVVEFFRRSPLVGVELDLERDRSLPRNVQL